MMCCFISSYHLALTSTSHINSTVDSFAPKFDNACILTAEEGILIPSAVHVLDLNELMLDSNEFEDYDESSCVSLPTLRQHPPNLNLTCACV
jgi:hypothetical protein